MKYQYPFTNHIIFALVMRDPSICKGMLQLFFPDREIAEVQLHEDQLTAEESDVEKTLILGPESRNVRLDVLFTDSKAWYDIEMQVRNEGNVPKRTRYAHAALDVDILKPGQDYSELKPGYVIFLCCFDCFGEDRPIYRFSMREDEMSLPLGDETYTIIVNSKASGSVPVPEPLQELFRYMNNCEVSNGNELIQRIDSSVELWNSPEGRRFIMTFEQELLIKENKAREEGRAEGLEEGRVEGRAEGRAGIVRWMREHGRSVEEIAENTGLSETEIAAFLEIAPAAAD